jgi:hypothetical protein
MEMRGKGRIGHRKVSWVHPRTHGPVAVIYGPGRPKVYPSLNAAARALFPKAGQKGTRAWLIYFARRGLRVRFLRRQYRYGRWAA